MCWIIVRLINFLQIYLICCDWVHARIRDLVLEKAKKYNLKRQNLKNNAYLQNLFSGWR